MPEDWIAAAQRSPMYALAKLFKVALPLHPEYRTMPMVWYVPPLSPVVDLLRDRATTREDAGNLFGASTRGEIVDYFAELHRAGPGKETGHADGTGSVPGRRISMTRRQQVVYLAAAWCLSYPDEEMIGRVPWCGRAGRISRRRGGLRRGP